VATVEVPVIVEVGDPVRGATELLEIPKGRRLSMVDHERQLRSLMLRWIITGIALAMPRERMAAKAHQLLRHKEETTLT
jgi:hypothetical protein